MQISIFIMTILIVVFLKDIDIQLEERNEMIERQEATLREILRIITKIYKEKEK